MARTLVAMLVGLAAATLAGCHATPLSHRDPAASAPAVGEDRWPTVLPQDGAWVRYLCTDELTSEQETKSPVVKISASLPGAPDNRRSEKITLSFVGSAVEKGVPCRWVEIKTEKSDDDGEKAAICKMLITEQALLESPRPLARRNVLRIWQKKFDGTVAERKKSPSHSQLFLWTPGAMSHFQYTGESQDFALASGPLDSAKGWSATNEYRQSTLLGLIRVRSELQEAVWQHPNLPAGFAGLKCTTTMFVSTLMNTAKAVRVTEYRVEDAGTGAQSELPDYE